MTTKPDTETIAWHESPELVAGMESLSFGRLLWAWRKGEGWSQQEAASQLGISKQLVSAYERGTKKPSLKQAYRIGEIFGVAETFALQIIEDELKELGLNYELKRLAS